MRRVASDGFARAAAIDQLRLSQALDAIGDLGPDRVTFEVTLRRKRGGRAPRTFCGARTMKGFVVTREHLDRF
jgi:hypothetical protein